MSNNLGDFAQHSAQHGWTASVPLQSAASHPGWGCLLEGSSTRSDGVKHNQGNAILTSKTQERKQKSMVGLLWACLLYSAELSLETHLMRLPTHCTSAPAAFILSDLFHHVLTTCPLWQLASSPLCPVRYFLHYLPSLLKATGSAIDKKFIYFKLSSLRQTWGKSEILFPQGHSREG